MAIRTLWTVRWNQMFQKPIQMRGLLKHERISVNVLGKSTKSGVLHIRWKLGQQQCKFYKKFFKINSLEYQVRTIISEHHLVLSQELRNSKLESSKETLLDISLLFSIFGGMESGMQKAKNQFLALEISYKQIRFENRIFLIFFFRTKDFGKREP